MSIICFFSLINSIKIDASLEQMTFQERESTFELFISEANKKFSDQYGYDWYLTNIDPYLNEKACDDTMLKKVLEKFRVLNLRENLIIDFLLKINPTTKAPYALESKNGKKVILLLDLFVQIKEAAIL